MAEATRAEEAAWEIVFPRIDSLGLTQDDEASLISAITAAIAKAVAEEREVCAAIAEGFACGMCGMDGKSAAAVRARRGGG